MERSRQGVPALGALCSTSESAHPVPITLNSAVWFRNGGAMTHHHGQDLFLEFYDVPQDDPRRKRGGLYQQYQSGAQLSCCL
eukprot:2818581-Amphidinium_carterae.1